MVMEEEHERVGRYGVGWYECRDAVCCLMVELGKYFWAILKGIRRHC